MWFSSHNPNIIVHNIQVFFFKLLLFHQNRSKLLLIHKRKTEMCIPIFIMRHWQPSNHDVFNKLCYKRSCDIKQFSWGWQISLISNFFWVTLIITPKYLQYLHFPGKFSDMKLSIWIESVLAHQILNSILLQQQLEIKRYPRIWNFSSSVLMSFQVATFQLNKFS